MATIVYTQNETWFIVDKFLHLRKRNKFYVFAMSKGKKVELQVWYINESHY